MRQYLRTNYLVILIIFATFLASYLVYPELPDKMTNHWGLRGEPNGEMSKLWGAYLMPFVFLFLYLMFAVLPAIDPCRSNIQKFGKKFDDFIVTLFFFFFCLHIFMLLWNLNYELNIGRVMAPLMAMLFYFVSELVSSAEPNFSIGIRTPWTLSCEDNWKKVHGAGGYVYKISAVLAFFGLFFPRFAFWLVIIPVIFSSIFLVAYSYYLFEKKEKAR